MQQSCTHPCRYLCWRRGWLDTNLRDDKRQRSMFRTSEPASLSRSPVTSKGCIIAVNSIYLWENNPKPSDLFARARSDSDHMQVLGWLDRDERKQKGSIVLLISPRPWPQPRALPPLNNDALSATTASICYDSNNRHMG